MGQAIIEVVAERFSICSFVRACSVLPVDRTR